MSDTELVVTVTAELFWREKSHATHELMLRKQANQKLQRIADQFSGPIREVILVALKDHD